MPRPEQDRVIEAVEEDDLVGFCLECGEERDGCEPDARGYECFNCGEQRVYGAQEILLMGYLEG